MKKRYIVLVSCLTVLLLSSAQLNAQQREEVLICREPKVSNEKVQQLIQSRKKALTNKTTATQKQLRVYFHICRNSDGTNAGATPADVTIEFQTLQADYTAGNICFVNAGLNYVDNTTLNNIDLDGDADAEDLFETHNIPGCLNVYYTYKIRGVNSASGGKIGGYSFNIPGTFCIVAKSSLARKTTSHEIGHCLGLFHTFSAKGFGYEFINGDDCAIRGDLICDTRADPYAYNGEDCFSKDDDGYYNGNCEDPGGHKNFSPPYNNLMSYWRYGTVILTPDQFTAMRSTIDDEDDLQNVSSSSTFTMFPATYNFEFIYRSAIGKLQTLGTVEFAGASTGGLFGSQVVLTPGFYAHPQLSSVKIAAAECSTNGFTAIAQTSSSPQNKAIKSTSKPVKAELVIYPNPAISYFNIQYSRHTAFNAIITIRNTNGAIVYSANRRNVLKLQERIGLSVKAKGIYFVEINVDGERFTEKLILQ